MFDLEQKISSCFKEMNASGQISQLIEENMKRKVASTIKEIVDEIFNYNSNTKKSLKEAIELSLKFDLSKHTLPEMSTIILQTVSNELEYQINSFGVEKAKEAVKKIVEQLVPQKISFEQLIEDFIKSEVLEDERRSGGRISLFIDNRESLIFVHIDKDPEESEYACEHSITLNRNGSIHSYEFKGQKQMSQAFFGATYGFQRRLFQMYAAGTIIEGVSDCDPEDLKFYNDGEG